MGDNVSPTPSPNTVSGSIKLNRHTSGHPAWLQARGYTATLDGDTITVQGTGFVKELDLTAPDGGLAVLKGVIERKELLTYSTKLLTASGPVFGFPALRVLGPASALVCKPSKGSSGVKTASIFSAL